MYSTLNVNIQDVAEASLLKSLIQSNAKFGCVIVMEVATGEIKALANLGLEEGKYVEKYNYAVGMKDYPGFHFQRASYMAMIEDGKVRFSDTVATGNGKWK